MSGTWQERLFSRAEADENGCWIWQAGSLTSNGYPMFSGPTGYGSRTTTAHRWAYVATHGSAIPPGMQVDHLCNVKRCINPGHLEVVTPQENMRRRSIRKTHCKRGHEFTPDNTIRQKKGRSCRSCFNALRRGYRAAARKASREERAA